MDKQTALITGPSAGIGMELARCFAKDGARLVLVARRADKLQELAGTLQQEFGSEVVVLPMDLANADAPRKLAAELESKGIQVDVLVNNAGFGLRGLVQDLDCQRQVDMIQLNITTLTELTRLLLPGMIARNRGGVLNVGSTAAFQPGPNMAVYYATKAYVLSFSEALHEELKDTDVKCSCLCPGATESEFAAVADMGNTLLFKAGTMPAGKVAQAGYNGLLKNRPIVIPGVKNKVTAFSVRITPRSVIRKLVKKLQS